jgi:predicted TPR repeat methyltransferase
MPTSNINIRSRAVNIIMDLPNTPGMIIDLGCGWGSYGAELRSRGFTHSIIGVDAWRPYLERVAKLGHYNKLENMEIMEFLEETPQNPRPFTVWLLMDVLEHFSDEDGFMVLGLLENRFTFLSTPLWEYEQGPWEGNPYEEHKSWWSRKDLECEGFETLHLEEIDGIGDIGLFVRRPK